MKVDITWGASALLLFVVLYPDQQNAEAFTSSYRSSSLFFQSISQLPVRFQHDYRWEYHHLQLKKDKNDNGRAQATRSTSSQATNRQVKKNATATATTNPNQKRYSAAGQTKNHAQRRTRRRIHTQNEKTVVILYNKPKGVITSHSNNDSVASSSDDKVHSNNDNNKNNAKRRTVYEDVMSMEGYRNRCVSSKSDKIQKINANGKSFGEVTGIKSKLHAIGRLDVETTGLLLLTNDGGLVHHITNPSASTSFTGSNSNKDKMGKIRQKLKVVKTYDAVVMGYHTLDEGVEQEESLSSSSTQLRNLLDGVDIGEKFGGMTLPPHDLQVLGHPSPKTTLIRISISEGKNRQIRRMFHAINSGVMKLHRRQVGDIELDADLEEGSWRILTEERVMSGLGWKVRDLHSDNHKSVGVKKRNNGKRSKLAVDHPRSRRSKSSSKGSRR